MSIRDLLADNIPAETKKSLVGIDARWADWKITALLFRIAIDPSHFPFYPLSSFLVVSQS
jgi:hypothetical protein